MAVSDAVYQAFLKSGEQISILIEFQYHQYSEPAGIKTAYYSNLGFQDGANYYLARLASDISYQSGISDDRLLGLADAAWGTIYLDNGDGSLDFLQDTTYEGKNISIFTGSKSWIKSDYIEFLRGYISEIVVSRPVVEIHVRTASWFLNKNIQKNFYQSGEILAGEPHPICVGPCFNISPVQMAVGAIGYTGGKWHCNSNWTSLHQPSGPVYFGTRMVYDDGVPLTYKAALPATAGTWVPFQETLFSPNVGVASGFYLGSVPAGVVTADHVGGFAGTTANFHLAPLSAALASLVSPTSISYEYAGIGSPRPVDLAFFSRGLTNCQTTIDQLARSNAAFIILDSTGKFIVGRRSFPNQESAPTLAITESDIVDETFKMAGRIGGASEASIKYFKNWNVLSKTGSPPAGYENRMVRAKSEYLTLKALATSPGDFSRPADAIESLLHGFSTWFTWSGVGDQATSIGDDLKFVDHYPKREWDVELSPIGLFLKPGDILRVTHSRFGFSSGRSFLVRNMRASIGFSNKVGFTLWEEAPK